MDLLNSTMRIEDLLTNSIVRIEGTGTGTGFVVRNDGLIVTCAHVLGTSRPEKARVLFHGDDAQREATVLAEGWCPAHLEDVALLRVSGALPAHVKPLPLGSSLGTKGHSLVTFGYPKAGEVEGALGMGNIQGPGSKTKAGQPLLQLRSSEITEGFSGAPVWDEVRRRVVGMVVIVTKTDHLGRLNETAYATPTEILREVLSPFLHISDICPYRNLKAFTEADAEFFCGRASIIKKLEKNLLNEPHFLAVFGASGSGKSSVIQAGLIPRLRKGVFPGSDQIIVTSPKDSLFEHHLAHLDEASAPRVLIIDQFEDFFGSYDEKASVKVMTQLAQILEHSPHVTLLIVMRNDFYHLFVQHEALAMWLEGRIVNVPPTLTREEVVSIVWEPAEHIGLSFDDGLVEMIVDDVLASSKEGRSKDGSSTILPLLEVTLTQLWENRQDGFLKRDEYYRIGRVTGALTQWADNAYSEFEEKLRPLVQQVFTDLVHVGDKDQPIPDSRRRRALSTLTHSGTEGTDISQIVQQLVAARLLVTDQDQKSKQETVEIIHDALLWEWWQLKGWIEKNRTFLRWRQELEQRVQAWAETEARDKEKLLRGSDLRDAVTYLAKRPGELDQLQHEFIRASKDRERFEKRRGALLVVGGVGAVVLLLVMFVTLLTTNYSAIQATQIRACMQQHQLKEAHIAIRQGSFAVTFARCDWPPTAYAGLDGYSEIQVMTVYGPGQSEADGTNFADRITAPCQKLRLSYTFTTQGIDVHESSFTASANEIYTEDGKIWQGNSGLLNFYPERGEIVVLHNSKQHIDNAICV